SPPTSPLSYLVPLSSPATEVTAGRIQRQRGDAANAAPDPAAIGPERGSQSLDPAWGGEEGVAPRSGQRPVRSGAEQGLSTATADGSMRWWRRGTGASSSASRGGERGGATMTGTNGPRSSAVRAAATHDSGGGCLGTHEARDGAASSLQQQDPIPGRAGRRPTRPPDPGGPGRIQRLRELLTPHRRLHAEARSGSRGNSTTRPWGRRGTARSPAVGTNPGRCWTTGS
ncbi:unnamed protein product, partial [Urochloa humidicola]